MDSLPQWLVHMVDALESATSRARVETYSQLEDDTRTVSQALTTTGRVAQFYSTLIFNVNRMLLALAPRDDMS